MIKVTVKYKVMTEAIREFEVSEEYIRELANDYDFSNEEIIGELEDLIEYEKLTILPPDHRNVYEEGLYINDVLVKKRDNVVRDINSAIRADILKKFLED